MQYDFLEILKCPITKTKLRFQLISEFEKQYETGSLIEVKDGLLYSETGFVFPVIDGIPRLLVESVYDYAEFLKTNIADYEGMLKQIEQQYGKVLGYCKKKNKKTKASFAFEWSFLKPEKSDKLWHDESSSLIDVFLKETGEEATYFTGKIIADIGCGHGLMTSKSASIAKHSIGAEISKAVEMAYQRNKNKNAWYVQADLQYLPFDDSIFDLLYSSGVIHHTNDTEKSFLLIERIIRQGGKICLWLYHPQKSKLHKLMMWLRKFTSQLPLKIAFVFLLLFVFPFSFLIKKIKNKNAPNFREEMIDLLDGFTPEFRFEIPHEIAKNWLRQSGYDAIEITTSGQYGYAIIGKKK